MPASVKKHSCEKEHRLEYQLSERKLRGWRAVSAERLHGKGSNKRIVFVQTPGVQFEISNSMKLYPSVCHACTSDLKPVIYCLSQEHLDEFSNRIPPTSLTRKGHGTTGHGVETCQGNV